MMGKTMSKAVSPRSPMNKRLTYNRATISNQSLTDLLMCDLKTRKSSSVSPKKSNKQDNFFNNSQKNVLNESKVSDQEYR